MNLAILDLSEINLSDQINKVDKETREFIKDFDAFKFRFYSFYNDYPSGEAMYKVLSEYWDVFQSLIGLGCKLDKVCRDYIPDCGFEESNKLHMSKMKEFEKLEIKPGIMRIPKIIGIVDINFKFGA